MEKLNIICVDDQREVLATLNKDLDPLKNYFNIIECESADEAQEVLNEIDDEGEQVPLIICDHIMPGKNGIDFLIEINEDTRFLKTQKLILTGLATHQDTITAINKADIDQYMEKPWKREELIQTIKVLITKYLVHSGIDYQSLLEIMDQPTLYKELRTHGC
tara:strand:- start:178 stop:663 length:486 start_codon:yes stop_codon:yes gene_type:complete